MKRAALLALLPLVFATSAHADRWVLTGASSIPTTYWQGLTTDPAKKHVFFVGVFVGLWRTTPSLRQTAGPYQLLPPPAKIAPALES